MGMPPVGLFPEWDQIAPRIRAVPGVTGLTPTAASPLIGPNFFLSVWHTDGEPPD